MDLAEIKRKGENGAAFHTTDVFSLIAEVERLNLQIKTIESCPERCLWIEAATAEVAAERDRYKAALEAIANPVDYLRQRAEEDGCVLNGYAYTITRDPEWLISLAKDALAGMVRPACTSPQCHGSCNDCPEAEAVGG